MHARPATRCIATRAMQRAHCGASRRSNHVRGNLSEDFPMMALRSLFLFVDTFPSSVTLRESAFWFPFLLTVHVVSMCLFAGLIIMMDLRLWGIGNLKTPFSQVQRRLFPWQ